MPLWLWVKTRENNRVPSYKLIFMLCRDWDREGGWQMGIEDPKTLYVDLKDFSYQLGLGFPNRKGNYQTLEFYV